MIRTPRIFLFYWALILPLGSYLVYDYSTDYSAELEPVLRNTVQDGIQASKMINDDKLLEIRKYTDTYKLAGYQEINRKAKAARAQVSACQEMLAEIQSQKGRIDLAQTSEISAVLARLGDSLLVISDRDSLLAIDSQTLIFQPAATLQTPAAAAFFSNARPAQVDLFLADLSWKLELVLDGLLDFLYDKIRRDRIVFDGAYPMFVPRRCARAGQPFFADIFLAGYFTQPKNWQCLVDGRAYAFKHGLVKFDTVYNDPGEHRQQIVIRVRNPLTARLDQYSREFSINIQKP